MLGGFLAEEKCLVKSPSVDHQGDEKQEQKASFPKSPPLPPIESVAADYDVGELVINSPCKTVCFNDDFGP